MAKNKKKRRNNPAVAKSTVLNREEFISKYCRRCGICTIATSANFCYDTMYKQSPEEFVGCAHPILNNALEWPTKEAEQELFIEDTFCRTGACDTMLNPFDYKSTCEYISECRAAFNTQVSDDYAGDYNDFVSGGWDYAYDKATYGHNNRSQKPKQVAATVVNRTVYATFFTNGDDAWRKSMEQAIIDEDNSLK